MGTLFNIDGTTGVVDFQGKGTSELVIEQGTSDPGTGTLGQLFFRTDTAELKIWTGASFVVPSGTSSAGGWTDTGTIVKLTTDSDKVVIGTSETPVTAGLLEIYKAGSAILTLRNTTANIELNMFTASADAEIGTSTNHPLSFFTNNTIQMSIDTSGNVGINYTSPASIVGSTAGGLVVKDGGRAGSTTQIAFTDSSGNIQFGQLANGVTTFASATVSTFKIDTVGNIGIPATSKLFLDGTALTGDTYITEVSANEIAMFTNSIIGLFVNNTTVQIRAGHDLLIQSTQKLYLDGGGDTYLVESSANVIDVFAGGTIAMTLTSSSVGLDVGHSFAIQPTQKLYLDGGADTYISESSANVMDHHTDGALALRLTAAQDVYTVNYQDYSGTSTVTGWSSFTTKQIYYKKVGKLVFIEYNLAGTSNATTVSFTLPYTASNDVNVYGPVIAQDNNANKTTPGVAVLIANASTVNIYSDYTGSGTWTNTQNKRVAGQFFYQTT